MWIIWKSEGNKKKFLFLKFSFTLISDLKEMSIVFNDAEWKLFRERTQNFYWILEVLKNLFVYKRKKFILFLFLSIDGSMEAFANLDGRLFGGR